MCGRRQFLGSTAVLAGAAALDSAGTATAAEAPAPAPTAEQDHTLALIHATLLAAPGVRPPEHDATVLVRGDRVVATGPTAQLQVPPGARVVDLTGKHVIPGLIDAHAHSGGPEGVHPPLYPLLGVTTVREMWGTPTVRAWRDKVNAGRLLGPRWVIASTIVDSPPGLWTSDIWPVPTIEVRTDAEARSTVRRIRAEGADFIKVYSRLTREAYFALADEALRWGVPFAGHCPDAVTVSDASDAGQHSVEHLHPLLLSTSSKEEEIRRRLDAVRVNPRDPSTMSRVRGWFHAVHDLESAATRSYDPGRAHRLFDRLAANGTYVTPTLVTHHTMERPETLPSSDPEWTYLPRRQTAAWPAQLKELTGERTPEESAHLRDVNAHRTRLVGEMRRRGVPVLAGTDTGTSYLVPGFALHHELRRLTEAGLTPAQALQAATVEPSRALGTATEAGTVEPGKAADLVVLDADPLHDIRNTLRIDSVLTRGRLIDAAERRRLLAEVAEAAAAATPPART
ncbi:amidohydrolase family protein [Streptomyces cinnamoneus]|uniref:amidohydrolase family protein n=1 Tax=Streptomyces cinnamoneus TaxID=53446 RepID=UPI0011B0613C|nr:amidohydrolase family protein [Streptomyces cinnamoneus]